MIHHKNFFTLRISIREGLKLYLIDILPDIMDWVVDAATMT